MKKKANSTALPKTALVGAGYWGKNLARNLHEIGALEMICDASPSARKSMAEAYPEIMIEEDLSKALASKEIECICIATPAIRHFEDAKAALEADKHVFVEKPLALAPKEGAELVALAKARNRILFVGHILHYHPAIIKLKEMIAAGTIGRLEYIYSNRLNLGKIRREENILWSFAPHDISVILGLVGETPSLTESTGSFFLHPEIADITMTNLKFPSGIGAHIFVSWLNPFKEQRLVVTGSNGMVVFDDTCEIDGKLVLYPHTIEWRNGLPIPKKADGVIVKLSEGWREPLKAECEAFLDACRTGNAPLTDGAEGLRVLDILHKCEQSLIRGRTGSGTPVAAPPAAKPPYYAHPTAVVDSGAKIGPRTKIWHFSHIYGGCEIGADCILGQNVSIADGVKIGNNVKIQNNVSVYTGAEIADDVFLGPSCVLTNVTNPRSQVKRHSLYEKTIFHRGVTVGANATIVCGTTLGRYAFVAAGAVVAKDVPDYALMVGVPAKRKGWMSRHGHALTNPDADGVMVCPESGFRYREVEPGVLRCLDLDEEATLPENLQTGTKSYDSFKTK
jgi:UDP-2-acetamido-3-amino-2,3-dideoxy-glucuronate N-acetyltransferase